MEHILLAVEFTGVLLVDLEFVHEDAQGVIHEVVEFVIVFVLDGACLDGDVEEVLLNSSQVLLHLCAIQLNQPLQRPNTRLCFIRYQP